MDSSNIMYIILLLLTTKTFRYLSIFIDLHYVL